MTAMGWIQIALFGLLVLICVKPLGLYMAQVMVARAGKVLTHKLILCEV